MSALTHQLQVYKDCLAQPDPLAALKTAHDRANTPGVIEQPQSFEGAAQRNAERRADLRATR